MQEFDFGTLRSSTDRDLHSSYQTFNLRPDSSVYQGYNGKTASSVYSGPGPAEEASQYSTYGQSVMRRPIEEERPLSAFRDPSPPRESSMLNIHDPIAMHLLMETAIVDSKGYKILSFEELEELKKERTSITNRIEATRRKLALESKLRDAAQSLNRLYSTKGRRESNDSNTDNSPKSFRRNPFGSRTSNTINQTISRTDDEFVASSKKCDELSAELSKLEKRLDDVQRKILEHSAGILQMTHKGLKKNIRRTELPRSPESMISTSHGNLPTLDSADDFDERSFYRSTDFSNGITRSDGNMLSAKELQSLADTEKKFESLNNRLRGMVLQTDPTQKLDEVPQSAKNSSPAKPGLQIEAHLDYLARGLDTMEAAQAQTAQEAQKSMFDSEDRLEDINVRLHSILEKTNSAGEAPIVMPVESRAKSMQSQFSFSAMVLDKLHQRVELLVQQKDILTRQIQQQRELNSKSDAQRDGQITRLTTELNQIKESRLTEERETQNLRDQINALMEQLDSARQAAMLQETQRNKDSSRALEEEKQARRNAEVGFLARLKSAQAETVELQSVLAQMQLQAKSHSEQHTRQLSDVAHAKEQIDLELQKCRSEITQLKSAQAETTDLQSKLAQMELQARSQAEQHTKQLNDAIQAKEQTDLELQKCRSEMKELESEVVRAQTDLTVVRAELDGAYGTRAQRAADVSMNPAIQKEIDDLNEKNASLQKLVESLQAQTQSAGAGGEGLQKKVTMLQKELKETIEDYEIMTRASIEFEKERDQFEATVDALRERNDSLEAQLSDEKVKWLGARNSGQREPLETTSTMVLKNEFKKMMRDTRAENMKALRAEQEERRRLELIIKNMQKEQQQ